MASSETPPGRATLSERMKGALAEYGSVALVVYLVLFGSVLAGFSVAISAAGGVGTLAAAYIATKLTQPLRILATLAITPLVAVGLKRLQGKRGEVAVKPPPSP